MMRRLDRANVGFVNRAFGVNQRLVQVEQRVAQLLERLPDGCILLLAVLIFSFSLP